MAESVALPEMLRVREERAALRHSFFREDSPGGLSGESSFIQFTVNIPGRIKNSPMIRDIFQAGLSVLQKELPDGVLLPESSSEKTTGPEAFIRIPRPALSVKTITSFLEDGHILGRLWDMDVFDGPNSSVSRQDIGRPGRCCFLCKRPAHECARSRRHSLDEVLKHIQNLYYQYTEGL